MDLRLKHLGVRTVLSGVPPSTTIADLHLRARATLKLPLELEFELLFGFPPRPLRVDDSMDAASMTLQSSTLRDGDTLAVRVRNAPEGQRLSGDGGGGCACSTKRKAKAKAAAAPARRRGGVHTLSSTSVPRRESSATRRAAAGDGGFDPDYAPQESDGDDDAVQRRPRKKKAKRAKKKQQQKTATSSSSFSSSSQRPSPARNPRALPTAKRGGAADGMSIGRRHASASASAGLAALGPVASGGGSTTGSASGAVGSAIEYLRRAARADVAQAEAIATANFRLRAAMSGEWRSVVAARPTHLGHRLDSDSAAAQHWRTVSFRHGERANAHWASEVVEVFSRSEIVAFLTHVLAQPAEAARERENLRMFKMAQCSPRVFWSIVALYAVPRVPQAMEVAGMAAVGEAPTLAVGSKSATEGGIGGRVGDSGSADAGEGSSPLSHLHAKLDLDAVLPMLMPEADWSFLRTRRRTRSSRGRALDAATATAATATVETQVGGVGAGVVGGARAGGGKNEEEDVSAVFADVIAKSSVTHAEAAAASRAAARAQRLAAIAARGGGGGSSSSSAPTAPAQEVTSTAAAAAASSSSSAAPSAQGVAATKVGAILGSDAAAAAAAAAGIDSVAALAKSGTFALRNIVRKAACAAGAAGTDLAFANGFARLSEDKVLLWIDAAAAALKLSEGS